uniref:Uncharacterized protein n=1 Tax=Palpitomonas bilix TaxID=652834 RepID=A0A7S3DBD2_9EUKA|mmetsp:Transcript_30244/g.78195  ORF Transcript_30244/g.78195 Transcript_30244/m.78195 type:complete len:127 (+) Transcript_30244:201-581(+)
MCSCFTRLQPPSDVCVLSVTHPISPSSLSLFVSLSLLPSPLFPFYSFFVARRRTTLPPSSIHLLQGSPSQVAIGQETFGSSLGQKIVGRDWQWVRGQRKHTGEEYVQGSDPNRANNVREDPTDSPL